MTATGIEAVLMTLSQPGFSAEPKVGECGTVTARLNGRNGPGTVTITCGARAAYRIDRHGDTDWACSRHVTGVLHALPLYGPATVTHLRKPPS